MKRLLFGILALLVLLVAAVLIVPSFVNWNTYKPEIVAQAREATGRELAIDGDIRLKLLPAPALSVEQVRIANVEGAPSPDMATLKALDVRVALMPLLSGEIQVESVRLVEPVVVLERLADGRAGWDFAVEGGGAGGGPALRLDRFEVDNGTVTYRDLGSGREVLVEAVSMSGSAASLSGPFETEGEARVGELRFSFEARAGAFGGGRSVPLLLLLGVPGEAGGLTLSGNLGGSGEAARFEGTLKASADAPAKLLAAAGIAVKVPAPLAGKLELDGKLEATAAQLAANDLTLRMGETQATGAVSVALADQPSVDATVALNRVDLDAILAATGGKGDAAATDTTMPAIPADLKASLNLSVDGVAYRKGVLRQVRLAAGLDGGVVSIGQFGALLPGGSDLKLAGTVEQVENQPRFAGQVEMTSDNLRGLLTWLEVDASQVPAGRLGAMALTSQLRATPQLVEVYGMNLRLDASTITGGVAFLIQDRPSFGIDLAIDRFNVDGYLPAGAAGDDKPAASPLAVLDSFDTNFKLKVARLTYNRTPVDDIDVDLSLVGGKLDVRKATVANIAGASASLAASGGGFGAETPTFDASLRVLANDITGLARLLRVELPVPGAQLGKADLRASLAGTARKLDLDGAATLGQMKLAAKGAVSDVLGSPRADVTLDFNHPSLTGLSKLLRLGVAPLKGNDSAVSMVAAVKGHADAIDVDGNLKAAGATLTAAGRFAELQATPKLDVAVNLVHADLRGFMRGMGVDYDPALQQLGGLGMSARLRGDTAAMDISEFKGVFGPVQVSGTGALKLGGARPYVSADLQTNQIIADFFLAPAQQAGGGGGGARQGGAQAMPAAGRWSREPIDLTGLGAVDADVKLAAKQISFDRYDFVDPKLTLVLRDGVLDVTPLTGKLFDGAVSLTAKLGSRPRPALDLAIDLKGADMRKALVTAAGRSDLSGRLDLDGNFRTTGSSAWALISGLAGQARIGGGDGAIEGIDMGMLSQRLGRLNKLPDFLDLMNRAFSGGQTRLHTLSGNWVVRDGVARSNDTVAQLDASVANVVGVIDLPAWELDIRSVLTLSEHPDAPPIGVDLRGPLDNPRRDVKTRDLERFVAQRVGETVLRKTLGDGKDDKKLDRLLDKTLGKPKQDDGGNGQRDAVKGLLKGILKGQ